MKQNLGAVVFRRVLLVALVVVAVVLAFRSCTPEHREPQQLPQSSNRNVVSLALPKIVADQLLTGSIAIDNAGDSRARYSIQAALKGSRRLAKRVRLIVYRDSNKAPLYSGSLAGFGSHKIGVFAAGTQHKIRFRLIGPSSRADRAQFRRASVYVTFVCSSNTVKEKDRGQ